MKQQRVLYNGVEMIAGWPAQIEAAQLVSKYRIEGVAYDRVRYGDEQESWPPGACHDCAVVRGQFHVPSCDAEECPRCHQQALGCDCSHDDDAEQE